MPNPPAQTPRPLILDPARHAHLVPGIAAVHMSCITHDAMIATFLPPLDASRVEHWWRARLDEAARRLRVILLLVAGGDGAGAGAGGDAAEGAEVVAVVMFTTGTSETVPHVAGVEKYMVSPAWRRRGLGREVMLLLEREAKARGRTLLTLDTEEGSPAEFIYPRLGYIEVGRIPSYATSPKDGVRNAGIWFYKDLTLAD